MKEKKFSIYYIIPYEFFIPASADGLSLESELRKVSRTFLSILAVLNSAEVWLVSARLPISNFSKPLPSLWESFRVHQLELVSPSTSCSIAFFSSLEMSTYLLLLIYSFEGFSY